MKGGLRGWRGVEDNGLWALGVDHIAPLDVDKEVECSKKSAPRRGTDTGTS